MDCRTCQAPPSMGFPRQEYCSELPFSSPGYLLNPGIEPTSPSWHVGSLPLSHQGNPWLAIPLDRSILVEGKRTKNLGSLVQTHKKDNERNSSQIKGRYLWYYHPQFSSVVQSCLTLWDPMDCSMPSLPVHQQLPEFTQTHVHWVGGASPPSHPLSSTSPPTFHLSQHQDLFQWVRSSHQVAKVLEFQLQHQSFQWLFRTDFL